MRQWSQSEKERFARHAAVQAIDAQLDITEEELYQLECHMLWLRSLRASRETQVSS